MNSTRSSEVVELKPKPSPCPFCGQEATFDMDLPGVMCDGCGATGPTVSNESCDELDDDDAIERAGIAFWNKRV